MNRYRYGIRGVVLALFLLGGVRSGSADSVGLRTPRPHIAGDMTFDSRAAEYDAVYKDHWRITERQGFMVFGFRGARPFTFHALGSTENGKSHCFLNIYVNGKLHAERQFIEKDWQDYEIPAKAFAPGENTVRLELVGATHLWIDQARVGGNEPVVVVPPPPAPAVVVAKPPLPVVVSPPPAVLPAPVPVHPQVDLHRPRPEITGQIAFDSRAAEYDAVYKDHWRITERQGFMVFRFHGPHPFTFHALGSTENGKSHCFLNIYVNDKLHAERQFIEKDWQDYTIPAQAFAPGENTVRLELVGATHLWIDEARVGLTTEEGAADNPAADPRARRPRR